MGKLVSYPNWLVNLIGKRQIPRSLDWNYTSYQLLQDSDLPMAGLLAQEDRSAPNKQTIATLRTLIDQEMPYSLILFPDADHGMLPFIEDNGDITYTGYAPGYFQAEVDKLKRLTDTP